MTIVQFYDILALSYIAGNPKIWVRIAGEDAVEMELSEVVDKYYYRKVLWYNPDINMITIVREE